MKGWLCDLYAAIALDASGANKRQLGKRLLEEPEEIER
jgi:hypothetical protein